MFTQSLHPEFFAAMGQDALACIIEIFENNPAALQEVNRLADEADTGCVDYVRVNDRALIASALKHSTADAEVDNVPDWMSVQDSESITYTWDLATGEIAGFVSDATQSAELRLLFNNDVIVVIEA